MTKLYLILVAIVSFPATLLAAATGPSGPTGPVVPATPEAAVEMGSTAYAAINSGDWIVAIPPILMLIVWALNAIFKGMIPRKYLPTCSVVAAVVAAVAVNLAAMPPDAIWWQATLKAIGLGLTVGTAASGFWSFVGKKLLTKASPAAAEKPAAEPPKP